MGDLDPSGPDSPDSDQRPSASIASGPGSEPELTSTDGGEPYSDSGDFGADSAESADVGALVRQRIKRQGPVRFDRYVAMALYEPQAGFFAIGGRAGTAGGDFLTSPEVGPLFAKVLGRALDAWWDDLGRPDPFVVVDAGAGPATLARAIRVVAPRCSPALTWVLVERSPAQRALHAQRLALCEPWLALPPRPDDDTVQPDHEIDHETGHGTDRSGGGGAVAQVSAGDGPRFVSLAEMPAGRFDGVVLANELLDNLPFRLLERGGGQWSEVYVALSATSVDRTGEPRLVEQLIPLDGDDPLVELADALAPGAAAGARLPIQEAGARWLRDALDLVDRGRVVVIDYASDTASLTDRPWGEWVRTYRSHQRGAGPLVDPGHQDITCEVAWDQLARVRPLEMRQSQADFLAHHGIDELVEEGRRIWTERAHIGDLVAIEGRSRVREAEALCDPDGLGAFHVLSWHR